MKTTKIVPQETVAPKIPIAEECIQKMKSKEMTMEEASTCLTTFFGIPELNNADSEITKQQFIEFNMYLGGLFTDAKVLEMMGIQGGGPMNVTVYQNLRRVMFLGEFKGRLKGLLDKG